MLKFGKTKITWCERSLENPSIAFLHRQLEFGLEFGVKVMLYHVRFNSISTNKRDKGTTHRILNSIGCKLSNIMCNNLLGYTIRGCSICHELGVTRVV